MRVYVINLAARRDRLQHITSELQGVGVDFFRLEAVNGSTSAEVQALKDRRLCKSGYVISDAAIACSLSHMKAWRTLLDSDESHCAILEDDVLLSKDFAASLSTDWLPKDADVVRLETFKTRVHLSNSSSGSLGERGVYRMLTRQFGAAAYIVSREAAESLLEFMAPPADAADEVMFNDSYGWMTQANVYQVSPAMAVQADRLEGTNIRNAGFATGSIAERGLYCTPVSSENFVARLSRRLRNEILARQMCSSYCIVPFKR